MPEPTETTETPHFDEWCFVGRDGFINRVGRGATEARAREQATRCDRDYPHDAPHIVMRLVSMPAGAPAEGAA